MQENKTSTFTLGLEGANFVADDVAIGLSLAYSNQKSEIKFEDFFGAGEFETEISTFSVLPFAQYYFNTGSKVKPYLGAQGGFTLISTGDEDFEKTSGFSYGGRGGVAYFINNNVSIDLRVNYLRSSLNNKENNEAKDKLNSLSIGVGAFLYL